MPAGPFSFVPVLATKILYILPDLFQLKMHLCDILCDVGVGYDGSRFQSVGWIAYSRRSTSDECDGAISVKVHPEQGHQWEKMTDMKRVGGWVDADISAYPLHAHELSDGLRTSGYTGLAFE
jgi:hypothetical protein